MKIKEKISATRQNKRDVKSQERQRRGSYNMMHPKLSQDKTNIPVRSQVRKTLNQLRRLEATEQGLVSLGQFGVGLLNLIQATTKKLGRCFYNQHTMARMLGCHRATIQRKEQALKDMGLLEVDTIKRIGAKEVQVRTIKNPSILKNLLCLLTLSIAASITNFTLNATRLFNDLILYKKGEGSVMNLAAIRGGVPPDTREIQQAEPNRLTESEVEAIFGGIAVVQSPVSDPTTIELLRRQEAARARYQEAKRQWHREQNARLAGFRRIGEMFK